VPQDFIDEEIKTEPSEKDKILSKYFELQLTEEAIKAFEEKDYTKAAILSWSYIEEYFIQTQIQIIAKRQKVKLNQDFLQGLTSYHLIRYYYMISYDLEMFESLEKARKLRNAMTHGIYSTKSIKSVGSKAKLSAKCNLDLINPMFDREEGKIIAPSLLIAVNARNSLRAEMRVKLKSISDRYTK
jgi:hypothetical protein